MLVDFPSADFEYVPWVQSVSGNLPPVSPTVNWTDSRGWAEKRRCAYLVKKVDEKFMASRCQETLDGDSVTVSLTGTPTFTNLSSAVSGSGCQFTTELSAGDYIWKDSDAYPYEVESITDDNNLTLVEDYGKAGGAGAGSKVMGERAEAIRLRAEIKAQYPKT